MTEQEWLTSNDLRKMLEWIRVNNAHRRQNHAKDQFYFSNRKLRLFACACNDILGCEEMNEIDFIENMYQIAMNFAIWTPKSFRQIPDNILEAKASFLRDVFGNPWSPVSSPWLCQSCLGVIQQPKCNTINRSLCECLPEPLLYPWLNWNDGIVTKIAQRIYDESRFEDMPVLADALEEAGCDNLDIVWHLRGWERCSCLGMDDTCIRCVRNNVTTGMVYMNTKHVLGCWCLDLLLGKE